MTTHEEEVEIMAAIDQLIDRLNPEGSMLIIPIPNENPEEDGDMHSLNSVEGDAYTIAQSLVILLRRHPTLLLAFMEAFNAFREEFLTGSQEITEEVNRLSGLGGK